MTDFYGKMASTAVKLLTRFGTDAILKKGGVSVPDKINGSVTHTGGSEHSVKAVITDYNTKLFDGNTILIGDRKIIIDAKVKPIIGDTVVVSGSTWIVINVQASEPAGIPIVYTLQVRK